MNKRTLVKQIKRVEKVRNKYNFKIDKLHRQLEEKYEIPKIKALIGRYYKYQNSYNPEANWWLYRKIIGNKGSDLYVFDIEKDCYRDICIKTHTRCLSEDWKEITEKEYKTNTEKIFKELLTNYFKRFY